MSTDYTYHVHWSSEDREHVGTVAEFPSLSWLDADPRAALDGIRNLATEALTDIVIFRSRLHNQPRVFRGCAGGC